MQPRVRVTTLSLLAFCAATSLAARAETPWTTFDSAAADALVTKVVGPPETDDALSRIGTDILAYASKPDELVFSFRVVKVERPLVFSLPNGSIYLSRGVIEALKGGEGELAFLCASEAALVLDGGARTDEAVAGLLAGRGADDLLPAGLIEAVERTLTAERMLAADKTAMLYLARAGIPPLDGIRAVEALAAPGRHNVCVTPDLAEAATLLERKVKGMTVVTQLIEAATEFDFGVMDLVAQKYGAAVERFAKFLEVFPNNYAGWNNKGLCHYHLAIQSLGPEPFLLADAIAEFDTSFMTRKGRWLNRAEWQAAFDAYQRAIGLDPRRVEALSNIGNLYVVDEQFDEAVKYYGRALDTRPDYAPALNNYGVALARAAKTGPFPGQAVVRFAAACDSDPTLAEAQYNLGMARAEANMDASDVPLRRYLALAPGGVKAPEVRRQLRIAAEPAPGVGPPVAGQGPAPSIERELELWNRTRLALATRERDLLAMVNHRPDQRRSAPGQNVEVCGWSDQGLVVELIRGRVNRVVAGRPPGHEAKTVRGVKVGFETAEVKAKYGLPPAVSRQNPYDIWLYPRNGVGFFVIGRKVNKIFLFPVSD